MVYHKPPIHHDQIKDYGSLSLGMDKVKISPCTVSTSRLTILPKYGFVPMTASDILLGLLRKCSSLLHKYSMGNSRLYKDFINDHD